MNQFRAEGEGAYAAALDAGVSRLRQIFLTSVTEFIGLAPMIFEEASIAQFLKPMALSLAFGVLLCMPVTLILSPSLYMRQGYQGCLRQILALVTARLERRRAFGAGGIITRK